MLQIPLGIRTAVLERDGGSCRMCGQTKGLVCHHIRFGGDYQGMGGHRFHAVENIISLGGEYEHRCHDIVHRSKRLWVPILGALVAQDGLNGLQLVRWLRQGADPAQWGLDDVVALAAGRRGLPTRRP